MQKNINDSKQKIKAYDQEYKAFFPVKIYHKRDSKGN